MRAFSPRGKYGFFGCTASNAFGAAGIRRRGTITLLRYPCGLTRSTRCWRQHRSPSDKFCSKSCGSRTNLGNNMHLELIAAHKMTAFAGPEPTYQFEFARRSIGHRQANPTCWHIPRQRRNGHQCNSADPYIS